MDSLFILIPIALVFILLALVVFIWSVKSGQYDDLNTEGRRILFDDNSAPPQKKTSTSDAHSDDVGEPRT